MRDVNKESGRPNRVLLLTLGSTPQVVTETLFALATGTEPWVPNRIILATTEHGATLFRDGRHAERSRSISPLLGTDGMLFRLAAQLGFSLNPDQVELRVPMGLDGVPIDDIRTEAETRAFAEELHSTVASLTADLESELHVSLAGGRKTMSFIAGQVMSIFGRSQDHLSHVLVEPKELEWNDSFWWPGDGSPGSEDAIVQLYRVPYLRARAWLNPKQIMDVSPGFANAVDMADQSLGRPAMIIDLVQHELEVCGQKIELGAQQLASIALIAIAAKRGVLVETVVNWNPDDRKVRGLTIGGDREAAHRLWGFLYQCCNLDAIYDGNHILHFEAFDRSMEECLKGFSVDDRVASPMSRMRKELADELPPVLADRILAPRGLATLIDPQDITIVAPAVLRTHPDWPAELSVRAMAA
jgi:CRISPR-associated protein (TIGR02584 family)